MNIRMTYDPQGLYATERREALKLVAYLDQGKVLSNGYGHTGSDVFPGQVITKDQAEAWLQHDTLVAQNAVNDYVNVPLTQLQFDALVDFVYNIGVTAFRTSEMLKALNRKDYVEADAQFKRWVFVKGQVNRGLENRREAESEEFEGNPNA